MPAALPGEGREEAGGEQRGQQPRGRVRRVPDPRMRRRERAEVADLLTREVVAGRLQCTTEKPAGSQHHLADDAACSEESEAHRRARIQSGKAGATTIALRTNNRPVARRGLGDAALGASQRQRLLGPKPSCSPERPRGGPGKLPQQA